MNATIRCDKNTKNILDKIDIKSRFLKQAVETQINHQKMNIEKDDWILIPRGEYDLLLTEEDVQIKIVNYVIDYCRNLWQGRTTRNDYENMTFEDYFYAVEGFAKLNNFTLRVYNNAQSACEVVIDHRVGIHFSKFLEKLVTQIVELTNKRMDFVDAYGTGIVIHFSEPMNNPTFR